MRFNCAHVFTLEAEDPADFEAKLARYSARVRKASEKLDIGYGAGPMFGRPSVDRPQITEPDPPERLFDG